jgi:hypothetical protein
MSKGKKDDRVYENGVRVGLFRRGGKAGEHPGDKDGSAGVRSGVEGFCNRPMKGYGGASGGHAGRSPEGRAGKGGPGSGRRGR